MKLVPIKTRKISEEIIDQITDLMQEGSLSPGDRLLSERELAEKLQVSRPAVREALSALEMLGIIEIRPGEGTFIRQTTTDPVIKPLLLMLLLEHIVLEDALDVRKILEGATAKLAAKRIRPDSLAKIETALLEMERNVKEGRYGADADMKFHYAIAEASLNSLLLRLMNTISGSIRQSLKSSWPKRFTSLESASKIYEEHVHIYQAIMEGDGPLAEKHMIDHLNEVEMVLLSDVDVVSPEKSVGESD